MHKGDGLRQVLVAAERARQRTGDLRHLDRMGEALAEMIAFMGDEHLRLVLQAPEGSGMDDPVPVALIGRSRRARRFRMQASPRLRGIAGVGSTGTVSEADAVEGRRNGHCAAC